MTEVHLIFTGIVGFVPTEDGRLTVIVQDARNPTDHESHVPHVVIEAGAYESSANLPDLGTHNGLRGFLLDHHAIEVTGSQDLDFTVDPSFDHYVLKLEGGCPAGTPGCGAIRPDLLTGPVQSSVAARMPLPNGRVETTFVALNEQWHFEGPVPDPTPVYLAEETCHNFQIDDGSVLRLSFTSAGSTDGYLQVQVPQGQSTIEVRIGNLPLKVVFETPPQQPPENDHHVKLYYDLAKDPPDPRPALIYSQAPTLPDPPQEGHLPYKPHRLSYRGPQMVRGPNCPPALWSA